jgi:hypothetical protein
MDGSVLDLIPLNISDFVKPNKTYFVKLKFVFHKAQHFAVILAHNRKQVIHNVDSQLEKLG